MIYIVYLNILIMNQTEFHLVHNQEEKFLYDQISFNVEVVILRRVKGASAYLQRTWTRYRLGVKLYNWVLIRKKYIFKYIRLSSYLR